MNRQESRFPRLWLFTRMRLDTLRVRLMALLGVITLAILLFAEIGVISFTRRVEQAAWRDRQGEAARSAAQTVAAFMQRVEDTLILITLLGADELETQPQVLRQVLDHNPALLEVVYLDANGRVISGAARERAVLANLLTIPQSQWFLQARAGQHYQGSVQLSSASQPYLVVALAVAEGRVIAARLSMDVMWQVVADIRFGQGGHAYVIDRQGKIIAHTDPQVVLAGATLAGRPELAAVLRTPDHEWYGTYVNWEGVAVVSATDPVTHTEWIVITELPQREAFAASRTAWFVLGGGLLVFLTLVNWLAHRFLVQFVFLPMEKLRAGAERFGQGDLAYQIAVGARDELGRLTDAFNEMAANLRRAQGELRAWAAQLEQRVAERTATLRAISSRQEAILAAVPDIIMEVDNNRVYTWANPAGLEFFGADVIGKEAAFYFEGEQDTYQTVKPLFYGNETVVYVESWQRRQAGEKRLLAWWCRVLKDENENVTGALSSARDITERKQAEEALEAERRLLRTLLDNIPDAIYFKDAESRFMQISLAHARQFGLSDPAQAIGKTDFDFFTEEHARAAYEDEQAIVRSGQPLVGKEEKETWPDGHVTWVSTTKMPLHDRAGHIVGTFGISRDITERKRAEEALRMSETRLRAILDATPFPIALVDAQDNNIDFWSRSALTLFGHTAPTATEWYQIAYPDPDYRREVIDRWKPTLEKARLSTQAVNTGEYRVACRNGSVRICELYAAFLTDRLIVTFNDITERKQAEEALRRAHDDLARSNTDLERFAYVASHDLQEPLRMVASFVQLLAERYRGQLDADADEFIGFAVDGAKRMQTLINDLLEYSRVGTHGAPLQPTDANAALDDALWNLDLAISDAGATVTHDPLPTIIADPIQLAQLFQNLIGNAIKFHGAEPPVVHVSAQETFEVSETSKVWRFSVRDNGIGMDPQDHARIFGIFQRLHGRDEYPGTGIGLAVCQRIVERHGGRIWVESQVGQGTTFFFTLPTTT